MSLENIISELRTSTSELNQLILISTNNSQTSSITENKKHQLINVIVTHFHTLLSSNFKSKQSFWIFVSKHVNNLVTRFCIMYDDEIEIEGDNIYEKKGKNWILFSLLENSFKHTYNELFEYLEDNQNLDDENANILIKYKNDINDVIKQLNEINFNNIFNPDYENYLDYKNNLKSSDNNSTKNFEIDLGSPIHVKRSFKTSQKINDLDSEFEVLPFIDELEKIPFQSNNENIIIETEEDFDKLELKLNLYEKEEIKKKKEEDFLFEKKADFGPNIVDNFYTFMPRPRNRRVSIFFEDERNSNIFFNSINDDENFINFNNNNDFIRKNSELLLHLKNKSERHLPSDKLYELKNKTIIKKEEIIYNKKKTIITNSHYLYLTQFYQKIFAFKFYNHKLHETITSLKQQNYQCFICLKKFSFLFSLIPLESIYWCSYYLHFVCKNCIAKEYSIIPNMIFNHWNFEKFSVSKKGKQIIESYYKEPIIDIKKNDPILSLIPESIKKLKSDLNNLYDYIKCDENFVLDDIINPKDKYLFLVQNIFSLKDLLDIHNKSFAKKLKEIKNKLIQHIQINNCNICKYEGYICNKCFSEEIIHFYDSDNIIYEKENNICYHKNCQNL